jgi:hypothetical protein
MPSPYKSNKYLTNSKLSAFADKISNAEKRDLTEAYRRGTLHDAYITNPKSINHYDYSVTTRYGDKYYYTAAELKVGKEMRDAFYADPYCQAVITQSQLQEEVYDDGVDFGGMIMACACTCDGRLKHARWPWDLKRTIATSVEAFTDAFYSYDYDRQAFFYMEVCGADRMEFFAQQDKKPYPVFKIKVLRGGEKWQSGREKTIDLLTRYDILSEFL